MTTTFNTMPPSALRRPFVRRSIIAALATALVLALPGCSLIKLGYGQASAFAFRWLDRYVDFDDAQSLRARTALDDAHVWHRRTQLPDYVQLLARAETEVAGEATPERMCAWAGEIRARIEPVLQYLAPAIADVVLTLSPAQLAQIEKRFAETNDEYRDEHLQRNHERRLKAEVKREVERAEMLYGDLDAAERELVVQSVGASPYSAEIAYAERKERQQDVLNLARRLREQNASRDQAIEQVRAYLNGLDRSPRESYRRYAERVSAHHCALASALHNKASAAQRREAAKKLAGYRADLRALIGDAAG
ncbi:MAG: DUF6279 family lipoprotein [Pseudomonadota bacterium]|nr:DUF6279 family lipoprotein [Pseudomonadota bacterium]